jgi:carboxyl-terminal processing protease
MLRRTLLAASATVALMLSPVAPASALDQGKINNEETYNLLSLFGDIFTRVRRDYVEEVDQKKLMEAAINGMLQSLDPHSSYLNEDNYRDLRVQTRGEFGGLGIEVTMENGWVKVVSPIDDTPAARAGLQPGDYITHLNGEAILGLTLNEAVEKMRGKIDTDLTLSIRRQGEEPFDVTLTRAVIKIRSVRSHLEDDIGYVRITSFNELTYSGLEKSIKEFRKIKKDQLKGLVIDLRNNPGGLLDQAVAVSDAFLNSGEIVSTRSRDPQESQRFNAKKGDLANGLPIVVLINDGSASASEIVAGALQDHRRAIIMGVRSFGKGSVQTIIPMSSEVALRLTTARYYTPSGASIQGLGIEPDIIVEQAKVETLKNNFPRRSEAQLHNALKNDSLEEDDQKDKNADNKAEKTKADYQLTRALDLIKGLALYQNAGK